MLEGGWLVSPEMEPALMLKLTVPSSVLTEAEVIEVGACAECIFITAISEKPVKALRGEVLPGPSQVAWLYPAAQTSPEESEAMPAP